jgi:hypothetical protein
VIKGADRTLGIVLFPRSVLTLCLCLFLFNVFGREVIEKERILIGMLKVHRSTTVDEDVCDHANMV